MQYLNPQIAALAKKKSANLVRPQVSCGIFQEILKEEHIEPIAKPKN